MKQKISYSSVWSWITIIYFIVFVAIFVLFWVFINQPYDNVFFWILVGLFALSLLWVCGMMPYSVDADDEYVGERKPLKTHRYRYSDIQSAEILDAKQSADEDTRFSFHGKYKYPVLITLKDGRKIILGSEDPVELVDYINSKIS